VISLVGKRIVITGAAGGIGSKTAELVANTGGDVALVDIRSAGLDTLADALRAKGVSVSVHEADVTSIASVGALEYDVRQTGADAFGIVNCAGVSFGERLGDDDFMDKWSKTFRINVDGPAIMTSTFIDQLKRTTGAIVNVASTCAFQAGNGATGYTAAKGAVRLMTQSFARDLAPYGIRVNAVAPALIATEMTTQQMADPEKMMNFNTRSMMKRPGRPEEVAGPIVVLLSALTSYMTGVTVPVDGGILA
jgi:NAD(P)-dependent dehydrogenase (short-subunit alcohol dehydrogenase family)